MSQWIKCSERMPELAENVWRTPMPLLVACELGVLPAYYAEHWDAEGMKVGFIQSLVYGDGKGNYASQHEGSRLMSNVTHWQPLPSPPEDV